MTSEWLEQRGRQARRGIYCGLAPTDYRELALARPSWDLMVTDGELVTTYNREGGDGPVEPLVLAREFHGLHPSYLEIVQEFRLFHNLWWDGMRRAYVMGHEYGLGHEDVSEEVAIQSSDNEMRVKTRHLRQY